MYCEPEKHCRTQCRVCGPALLKATEGHFACFSKAPLPAFLSDRWNDVGQGRAVGPLRDPAEPPRSSSVQTASSATLTGPQPPQPP